MNNRQFYSMCNDILREIRKVAPKRTGNLAYNSLKMEFVGNTCKIYVDEDIAPYMPFTNEPWISPRWNGKQNPNEGWWGRGANRINDLIFTRLGDSISTAITPQGVYRRNLEE